MGYGNAVMGFAAVIGVGTLYVLLHEKKRKRKKLEKQLQDQPISKELLLKILHRAADNSKIVVDKIRVEVRKAQVAKNLSDEQTMQLFQTNFEHSLDQLIGAIRSSFNVTEKAMDTSFKQHQGDPEVQEAIQNMRVLSANSPAQGGASGSQATVTIPASLTRERLKEIMTFNATTLEKELHPIKEEMARQRKLGKTPQVDPQALMGLQQRISSQVQDKYGVTDEQVYAAVEHYNAKTDPAFKDILARIAHTLNTSLA
jgi:predicted metal-dependent hydrolase